MDEPAHPPPPPLSWWGGTWRLLAMLTVSAVAWLPIAEVQLRDAQWLFWLDLALGLGCYLLVRHRRQWPLPVALVTSVLAGISGIAAGPATLATVSIATRRRWRQLVLVGVVGVVGAQVFTLTQSGDGGDPIWLLSALNVIVVSACIGWGMYVGSRRELVWTLRQRAERAEAEQELRVSGARDAERARIAREMHDVLAHKISQISMHAGALSFREGLTSDEMRSSAAVIRTKAHEAITDLRGVLGVLRGEVLDTPQPTYADLPALVEEARGSGLTVVYADRLGSGVPVPDAVGRTLYRIVQEGLTNARKHAPGSTVTAELSGSPEDGVTVRLSNPLGFGTSQTPGAGLGLVGLAERAELRGGHLVHGREDSAFVLHGWIPWAP